MAISLKSLYRHRFMSFNQLIKRKLTIVSNSHIPGETVRVLRRSNYERQLWKNGLGYTHEIAVLKNDGNQKAPFSWRLSMADLTPVVDGAFSCMECIDRTILLLGGDCKIQVNGAVPIELALHKPFQFSGDVPTISTVCSMGRDLNCMVDRSLYRSAVRIASQTDTAIVVDSEPKSQVLLAVSIGGPTKVSICGINGEKEFSLDENDAIRCDISAGTSSTARITSGKAFVVVISSVKN